MLLLALSVVFALITVGGSSLDTSYSLGAVQLWTLRPQNLINAALALAGTTIFFFEALGAVGTLQHSFPVLCNYVETAQADTPLGHTMLRRGNHLHRLTLLWAVWFPQVLLRYPGVPGFDAFHSLSMYYGMNPWTAKHPAIYGLTIGLFTDIGKSVGAVHIGIFLMSLSQLVLLSIAALYTLYVMEQLNIPRPVVALSLVFFALCPIFVTSITLINKDVFFCIAFVLLFDEIALLLFDQSFEKRLLVGHLSLVALSVFGMSYRNNGVFIIAATAFLLTLWHFTQIHNAKSSCFSSKTLVIVALIVSIVAAQCFTSALNKKLEVEPAPSRVIYSLPIQQIARYLCFHPDGFTETELADLQTVIKLDHETCVEHYTPHSFDGVKSYFTKDLTREKSLSFLKLWLTAVSRDPFTCIDATVAQNVCLFSPRAIDFRQYEFIDDYSVFGGGHPADFSAEVHDIALLQPAQRALICLYDSIASTPILGLSMQESFYVVLLFGCIVHSLNRDRGRWLLLAVPLLTVFFFVFVGPAIEENTRYMYPIMWSAPLWLGLFLSLGPSTYHEPHHAGGRMTNGNSQTHSER